MVKKELVKRSPIRVLEKSIHGGLGKGKIGVFTARKGVGKTACLVHFAIDKLINDQKVLHISFAEEPHHIESWYKQVFNEVAKAYKLENTSIFYNEIVPNRIILHYKKTSYNFEIIRQSIERIIRDGAFLPEMIIVDGFDFEANDPAQLSHWKELAQERNAEIWFSATLHMENMQFDERGIPAPVNRFTDLFSVIIMLLPMQDHIDLKLLKDNDSMDLEKLRLKLDPHTMLIANRRA